MFRHYSQALLIALTCSCLAIAISPARNAFAATDDGSIAAKSDAQVENPATKIATPSVPEKRASFDRTVASAEKSSKAAFDLDSTAKLTWLLTNGFDA